MEGVGGVGAEVLLAVPGFGCPTGAVYRAFDASPTARGRASVETVRGVVNRALAEGKIDAAALVNDLAAPAAAVQPRLTEVLSTLTRELGGGWHLTGSGSCCYRIGAGPGGPLPEVEGVRLVRARLV